VLEFDLPLPPLTGVAGYLSTPPLCCRCLACRPDDSTSPPRSSVVRVSRIGRDKPHRDGRVV